LCDKNTKRFEKAKWFREGQDKDSLEVIKLSLLRNLTPNQYRRQKKKRNKKEKAKCNSSNIPKATQDKINPLRCWGNEMGHSSQK
jgi:hypothetical protein